MTTDQERAEAKIKQINTVLDKLTAENERLATRVDSLTKALLTTGTYDPARQDEAKRYALRLVIALRDGDVLQLQSVLADMANKEITANVAATVATIASEGMDRAYGHEEAGRILRFQLADTYGEEP
jgi:hypothetical protein